MNRIVHFEIPSDNPEKLKEFYGTVFGWEFEGWGDEPYFLAVTGPEDKGGINGAIMKRRDPKQPVVNTLSVQSIDKMITVIEKHGGAIVVPKAAVGDMGWVAYFTDPEGNIHGLWETTP